MRSTRKKSFARAPAESRTSRLQRPLAIPSHLPEPHAVHLSRQGTLAFQWYPTATSRYGRGRPPLRRVSSRLWRQFVRLADRDDKAIRRFAGLWGPLRRSPPSSPGTESVAEWRQTAVLARALLRTDEAIHRDQPGLEEDWKTILHWLGRAYEPELTSPRTKRPGAIVLRRRAIVVSALNRWYSSSPGNEILVLDGEGITIRPEVTTLFGIIGAQLIYEVLRAENALVCYHCHAWFVPRRIPSTGSRQFCPRCRKQAKPQLYAMRDYRQRESLIER